jgi:hypothetical protein
MMNTSQFTRTTKLSWRTKEPKEVHTIPISVGKLPPRRATIGTTAKSMAYPIPECKGKSPRRRNL